MGAAAGADCYRVGVESIEAIVSERIEDRYIVGRTIVSETLLDKLKAKIDALEGEEKDYFLVQEILEAHELGDGVLERIGYRVEWRSLVPPDARVVKVEGWK
ncbi:MAG: hypothetical protein ACE5JP_16755 [Candidatus Bipolaricaulia bacterium]